MEHKYQPGQRVWVEGSEGIPARKGIIIQRHDVKGERGYIVLLDDGMRDLVHEELVSSVREPNETSRPQSQVNKRTLNDALRRLSALEKLRDGWLDGEGKAPPRALLELLRPLLCLLIERFDLPVPYLYPTPDGDVQAEWSFDGWEVSATFHGEKTPQTTLLAVNVDVLNEDRFEELKVRHLDDSGLQDIAAFVGKFAEGGET